MKHGGNQNKIVDKMDATKKTPCPSCDCDKMGGWGGSFGGRINSWKLKCPECDFTILIVPMKPKYEYTISARSEEEIIEREEKRNEWSIKRDKLKKLREEITRMEMEYNFD